VNIAFLRRVGRRGTSDALDLGMAETTRSTEYYGQGQSGYTAGRTAGDPALGIEGLNSAYPKGTDFEDVLEEGNDERWVGAGNVPWAPEEVKYEPEPAPPTADDARYT
jgi:hypothetical protein